MPVRLHKRARELAVDARIPLHELAPRLRRALALVHVVREQYLLSKSGCMPRWTTGAREMSGRSTSSSATTRRPGASRDYLIEIFIHLLFSMLQAKKSAMTAVRVAAIGERAF